MDLNTRIRDWNSAVAALEIDVHIVLHCRQTTWQNRHNSLQRSSDLVMDRPNDELPIKETNSNVEQKLLAMLDSFST